MLDERITIHDTAQLEFRQPLPFPEPGTVSRYTAETWLFVPASLNINRFTFPKEHFYRSLKNYIRLQAPSVPLDRLTGPGSLLDVLRKRFAVLPRPFDETLLTGEELRYFQRLERRSKLFCLSFKEAMSAEVKRIIQAGDEKDVLLFTSRAAIVLQDLWALGEDLEGDKPVFLDAIREYSGNAAEYHCLLLLRFLRQREESAESKRAAASLAALIRADEARRETLSPDAVLSPGGDNETFMLRLGSLKKYVSRPLFLDIHNRRESELIKHLAYGIAAALAMIFATLIAFLWQARYGAVSLPLFVALVVSYIFKDRLKDILREYMTGLLARRTFDRGLTIYQGASALGTCKELFGFMETRHLSSEIRTLRELADKQTPFLHAAEEIMYHRKRIVLKRASTEGFDTQGILDISRINFEEFFRNMDGKTEKLLALDDSGESTRCCSVSGVKTYPVYVVRRRTYGGAQGYSLFRLDLAYGEIRRITRLQESAL